MKRINFSVLSMFLILIMFLLLVAGWFHIMLSPRSHFDIFYKYVEDIMPGKNSSAFGYFDVQEYDNIKYFLDGSSDLCSIKDQKKNVIMEDVENFLFFENELVYTLLDDKKMYIQKICKIRVKVKLLMLVPKFF